MKLKKTFRSVLLALAAISISHPVLSNELSAYGFSNGSKIEFKIEDIIESFDKRIFSEQGTPGISRHPFEPNRYVLAFDRESKERVVTLFSRAHNIALKHKIEQYTNGVDFDMLEMPELAFELNHVGMGSYREIDGIDVIFIGDDIKYEARNLSVDYKTIFQLEALSRASFNTLAKSHEEHLSRANADMLAAFYLMSQGGLGSFGDLFLYKSADTFITHNPNKHSLSGWKVRVAASFASRFIDSGYRVKDLAHNQELTDKLLDRMLSNEPVDVSSGLDVDFDIMRAQLFNYWEIAITNLAKRELIYNRNGCLSPFAISNGADILQMVKLNASSETLCKVGSAINTRGLKESVISDLAEDTISKFIIKDGDSYLMQSKATRDFLIMFDSSYSVRVDDILNK
ncbi:hypothetical protein LMH73_015690 [Vibrio splendidus]|nr:hypothetical protein [Vibrio splendidus]MCC4881469.1 hypothetical protein [Vibrio splendidus]